MYPFSLSKLARACEVGSGIWLSRLYFLDFIIHRQLRSLSVQVGLAFVQLGQPSFNLNDIILFITSRLGCRCWIRWVIFAWDNYFPKSLTDWATKLKYSLCKPHFFLCLVLHTNPLPPIYRGMSKSFSKLTMRTGFLIVRAIGYNIRLSNSKPIKYPFYIRNWQWPKVLPPHLAMSSYPRRCV